VPDSVCPVSVTRKKFVGEKTCTRLTDTRASFLYKTTCTSFWYKFVEHLLSAMLCWCMMEVCQLLCDWYVQDRHVDHFSRQTP